MSQLKTIKDRIDSVVQTCKITQAMKMVAAAKFKSASDLVVNSRDYMDQLSSMLAVLLKQSDFSEIPLLTTYEKAEKEAVIVISGDRGLCGGFNANLIKKVNHYYSDNQKNIDYYFWGLKAYDFFKKRGFVIKATESGLSSKTNIKDVIDLLEPIIAAYVSGEYSSIKVIYTSFQSIVSSIPVVKQLAPIEIDVDTEVQDIDYFIEPNSDEVLKSVSEQYVNLYVYRSIIESFSAEQGARMMAMDSATDNAKEVINDLKLQYNRGRQAQITTELSEIVAGAEALVQ